MKIVTTVFIFCFCFFYRVNAQFSEMERTTHAMPAGSQFEASGWKQFWWGKHWREEWTTPANFPVFDLDTVAGGLTAIKLGGGHETKTLRLMGGNGKEYVLRTLDKSLDILLPATFRGSFLNDLMNDQISTAHPYGALTVAQLSSAIGILHTNPVFVFVPDNSRLGEFHNDFANKLCLFEERPSGEGWRHTSLTRDADDIINSEKLMEKLKADPDSRVNQQAFLKVRMFDFLINDWDRHDDQWIWAAKKEKGIQVFEAFARDRDQSFSKTDGVSLYFLSRPWALRSLQNMNSTVTDVIGNGLSATGLDKQFTNQLSVGDWQNTIQQLQLQLPDSVILEALHRMPENIFALSGDFLYQRLRSRRDHMMDYGMRYYEILNKEVFITGTDKREIFSVKKIDDHKTEITLLSSHKKRQLDDTIYHRVFDHSITKTINLYGFDGNDQFTFTGVANNKILVRVIGGDGKDIYSDSIPPRIHARNFVYDTPGERPQHSHALHYRATTDTSVTQYHRDSFKYDWWMPLVIPGYNPDDGVVLGAGLTYKKMGWNKNPYRWEQSFIAKYAAATGAFSLFYKGIFKETIGKWDLDISANYKAPSFVVNFYGFGNDTRLLTDEKSFYRVRARSVFLNPSARRSWSNNSFQAGLIFNTVKIESADNKFINQAIAALDSSVFSTKYFGGADIAYTYNTSNSVKYPTRGIRYQAGTSYYVNLKETSRDYLNLQSSFTIYYSPFKSLTLAHRTGAATNWGDYEFYQANTIGGMENLRGYWRTRFTGRSSFYQNTDVRWKIADLKGYVLRGALGIYGFFDDGRVWEKNETSHTIHTGYGGGIYFIPYSTLAINLSYASSREVNTFTFRTGFLF